ncbi:hypothetical protein [Streptomyces sp. NRRL F-2580]|uniref:hypothetical protein n=1 Tax=Streptomyces sp. NRRL F-2580 TaxID=1463841 RepID=UPI00068AB56A|nr:hypothetical protein [Streptomyces sp. NRRL F-2580]
MIGTFFSLALLFDGRSLIALGRGVRRILGLVREDEESRGTVPVDGAREPAAKCPAEDQEQSNN